MDLPLNLDFFPLMSVITFTIDSFNDLNHVKHEVKGIVSPDWKGLQMVSLDRFEV
jgi:hypothetical protein